MLIIYCVSLGLALISSWLILWRVPFIQERPVSNTANKKLSIIIPARNESNNLPILLQSIHQQKFQPFELLVIDDDSNDDTASVATENGAQVVTFQRDDQKWLGKSAACWAGAKASQGDYLLFLDADVSFTQVNSLSNIIAAFQIQDAQGALSIQPYHIVEKTYENFSTVFNIIVLVGMNQFSFFQNKFQTAGAFGPSLLVCRDTYFKVGGHAKSREAMMDHVELGKELIKQDLPVKLYGGKDTLNFRMYPEGLSELSQGWSKSFATAALATHPLITLGISLFIAGAFIAFSFPIYFVFTQQWVSALIALVGYVILGSHFWRMARLAGNFHWLALICYPILFGFFVGLFAWSGFKTFILRRVSWKGRDISL